MLLRTHIFKRVTIAGVGLIGGSLGLAIKKHQLAREVVGLSHRPASLSQAVKTNAIDIAETDIRKAVSNADLIILATPIEAMPNLFAVIGPHVKRGAIITDVGSAKVDIIESAEKNLATRDFSWVHIP